jgi:arylsulfatase A-like enzyme
MDIPPTILTLAGLTPPPGFGTPMPSDYETAYDLTPFALNAPTHDVPELVAFGDLYLARSKYAAIQNERYKLILNEESSGSTSIELYDLRADPGERHNIAEDHEDLVAQLRKKLMNWRSSRESASNPAEPIKLGPEHERMLRSLGYIN